MKIKNSKIAKSTKSTKAKPTKATKATKAKSDIKLRPVNREYIALGTKGTGFVLGSLPEGFPVGEAVALPWVRFKSAGVTALELCNTHSTGKAFGGQLACYDMQCHVSQKGQQVLILPLKTALSKKVVKAQKFVLNGGPTITGYVPAKWTSAEKVPSYVATMDVASGRIERGNVNEENPRNVALVGSLKAA